MEVQSLGVDNVLKGRVPHTVCACQLEFLTNLSPPPKVPPDIMWTGWRKKIIRALVEFTLSVWNDRNSVVHGTPLQHSRVDLIAHIHSEVTREYSLHLSQQDPFMAPHFLIPCETRLRSSLRSMRYWLKRVQTSRVSQRLRQEALTKIRDLQTSHFVNVESILALPNRDLAKWLRHKVEPSAQNQTTLHMFFSP